MSAYLPTYLPLCLPRQLPVRLGQRSPHNEPPSYHCHADRLNPIMRFVLLFVLEFSSLYHTCLRFFVPSILKRKISPITQPATHPGDIKGLELWEKNHKQVVHLTERLSKKIFYYCWIVGLETAAQGNQLPACLLVAPWNVCLHKWFFPFKMNMYSSSRSAQRGLAKFSAPFLWVELKIILSFRRHVKVPISYSYAIWKHTWSAWLIKIRWHGLPN